MVVNSGFLGSVSFTKVRTEFAGFNGSIPLSKYRIANGYAANHENNATIPTSNLNLGLSKWIGTDIDFESNSYTDGQGVGTSTLATNTWGYTTYYGACNTGGVNPQNVTFGIIGTVDVVGRSKSATTTTSLIAAYDYYFTISTTVPPPGTGARPGTIQGCALWFNTDTATGTWWSSATVNGVTRTRASADVPNGTSTAGVGVYWFWSGVSWSHNAAGTFTVTIVLT